MQVASEAPPLAGTRLFLRALPLLLIGIELGLILLTVYLFEVEKQHHLFPMLCLGAAGFVIQVLLPTTLRPAFFAILSMSAILLFLGWADGRWVLGIGAAVRQSN